jgi:tetratricopeptide (TPR) repeat protein
MDCFQVKLAERCLKLRYDPAQVKDTRAYAGDETLPFKDWIAAYRDALKQPKPHTRLLELGRAIYAWLDGDESIFRRVLSAPGTPLFLEVSVPPDPDDEAKSFLEVPWEIIADDQGHLAANPALLFCPLRRMGKAQEPLEPSAYRLSTVFMAAAPEQGGPPLQYEAEETAILQAAGQLGMDLTVEESGTLPLLVQCMAREKPVDVLHLSCHGDNDPQSCLLLEDDEGGPVPAGFSDLRSKLGQNMPRLLFVSACKTSEPNRFLNSFSTEIISRGCHAVLGWGGSVSDAEATRFTRFFYEYLSQQNTLEDSLARARSKLLASPDPDGYASRDWHMARLYIGAKGGGVLATGENGRKPLPPEAGVKEFLNIKDQTIQVAGRHEFVGRRRQIQKILGEYSRTGRTHAGVLIQGMGRQGKSSLAARIANRMDNTKTVVVYGHYHAEAMLDAIASFIGTKEMFQRIASSKEAYAGDPHSLESSLREILEGPCRHLEKNQKNDVIRWPILLVIDDFEQALDPPAPAGGLHRLQPELVDTYQALINAFAKAHTDSRLLFTSRYDFTLPQGNQDLAQALLHVPLPPMTSVESRKQAEAKKRTKKEKEQKNLDPGRVARCLKAGLGNPGLQDLLFSLIAEEPEQGDRALQAMDDFIKQSREPDQERLLEFLDGLLLDRLWNLLTTSERDILRASTLFSIPIPLEAYKPLHPDQSQEPGRRLLALGLWDQFNDLVDSAQLAVAVNPLLQPKAGRLSQEESEAVASQVLPELFRLWGGEDGSRRPFTASLQLAVLGILAENAQVLAACASAAVRGLEKKSQYKNAADLGTSAISHIDQAGLEMPVWLLLNTGYVCRLLGRVDIARDMVNRAVEEAGAGQDRTSDFNLGAALLNQGEMLYLAGQPDQALESLEKAVSLFEANDQVRERAITLGEIACILVHKGQVDQALEIHEEELKVYEELGDIRSRAITLGYIARILVDKGQVDKALEMHKEELKIFEDLGERRERAVTLGDIADILAGKGQVDQALKMYKEELKVYEELGDIHSQAITKGEIAHILADKGQVDKALEMHKERLAVSEKLGDPHSRASALGGIAHILAGKGRFDQALEMQKERLAVFEKLGDKRERALTLGYIARILVSKGQLDQALEMHKEELKVFEELGDIHCRASALGDIAYILADKGQLDQALEMQKERLAVFEELGNRQEKALALGDIAYILIDKGQVDQALKMHEERLAIYEETGDLDGKANTLWYIANFKLKQENYEEAFELLKESYRIALKLGRLEGICFVGLDLGELHCRNGQTKTGIEILKRSQEGFNEMGQDEKARKVEQIIKRIQQDKNPNQTES